MWVKPEKKPLLGLLNKLALLVTKTAEVQMQRKTVSVLALVKSMTKTESDVAKAKIKLMKD